MKISTLALLTLSVSLAACATKVRIPEVALDAPVFAKAEPEPMSKFETSVITVPEPLPLPGQLKPLPQKAERDKGSEQTDKPPEDRVAAANAAAKIEPGNDSTINAMQVYPFTQGALYQLYAAVNQVSDIAIEPGETLLSVSSGDTVRWVIGDTQSGAGASARTHILVKPTAANLATNLVIATDRRTYHLELTSTEKTYIASLSWTYPLSELVIRKRQAEARAEAREAVIDTGIALDSIRFRYRIDGDAPWRPAQVFDDGNKVYIQFPSTLRQGEAPPLFIAGADGKPALVNYRVKGSTYIVDRLPPAYRADHSDGCAMARGLEMTNSAETSTAPEKVDPDSVELRVKPRPVTRINRRVVIGGVALKQVCLSWPTIAGCDSVS